MVLGAPGLRVLNTATRLAVWGDPIAHSRSPQLHTAAYDVLGYDWQYGRRQVTASAFASELRALDASWRGLSVTYPLKAAAFDAAFSLDERARLTGAVNTLVLGAEGPHGYNTDVGGIVRALQEQGIEEVPAGRIVGAGATATAALIALAELGARRVEIAARRPDAAAPLIALGDALGMSVTAVPLDDPAPHDLPLTVATLPGDATIDADTASRLAQTGGLLLDAVYGTWPTPLAAEWRRAGRTALSGRGMLLHQAVLQIRIFTTGDPQTELPDEGAVLVAMRRAIGADAAVGD